MVPATSTPPANTNIPGRALPITAAPHALPLVLSVRADLVDKLGPESYSSSEYQIEAHLYQLGTNPLVQHTS